MNRKSFAAGLVLVAMALLTASAVISANAQSASQTAPPLDSRIDGAMNTLQSLKHLDVAKAPTTGDDKAACDLATRAQARFEAGLSTARARSRALERAKSLAGTAAMRRAIDSGLLPACPPDITPEVRS